MENFSFNTFNAINKITKRYQFSTWNIFKLLEQMLSRKVFCKNSVEVEFSLAIKKSGRTIKMIQPVFLIIRPNSASTEFLLDILREGICSSTVI